MTCPGAVVRGGVDSLDNRQIARTASDGTGVVTALPHLPATVSVVVGGIGLTIGSRSHANKFEVFHLTPTPASRVGASFVAECYANLECKVIDASMTTRYYCSSSKW